jgi:ABC-2 type transport system permease protein
MNRALLRKCLVEAQWLFAACGLAIFAFAWVRVWMISRLEMSKFQSIIYTLRDEVERFLPVSIEALFSYTGRVAVVYDEAVAVLCVMIWAISRGSDSVSGELGRGTMEMLLAQPISRLQVILHQAAVTVVGVALLSTLCFLGTFVGIQTLSTRQEKPSPSVITSLLELKWPWPKKPPGESETKEFEYVPLREKVDARNLLPGAVNLFALGFFVAAASTLVSACDRYRWRAIGVVVAFYIVELILKGVAVGVPGWRPLGYLTFFTAYEPQLLVQIAVNHPLEAWSFVRTTADANSRHIWPGLGPLGFCAILWGLGAACYGGAIARFCTRDLPPPL